MSVLEFALIGLAIGVITTAPVGPVNIMAIQHAAQQGFRQGLYVGLGAVIADAIYAAAAIFGVSAVTRFVEGQFALIETAGAALLVLFGLKIMKTHSHLDRDAGGRVKGIWGEVTAAFFMVLTNPGVVLAYVAIVGSLGQWRPQPGDHAGALAMVLGVVLGAAAWWALLSALVTRFSARIDDRWLDRANRIAGFVLIAFGLVIGANLIFGLFG